MSLLLSVFQIRNLCATISFGSAESRILLRTDTNSIFKSTRSSKITGWQQQSIVRAYTGNAANTWTPAIAFGTEYGNKVGGGATAATERLAYSTSNFVNAHWPTLRTTSNWVNVHGEAARGSSNWVNRYNDVVRGTSNVAIKAYTYGTAGLNLAVNNQSDIGVLQEDVSLAQFTADEAFTLARGNSNFVNAHWLTLRTTSNWVKAKDGLLRTTSNAVAAGSGGGTSELLRTTSNFVNAHWSTLRTSSNAVHSINNLMRSGFGLSTTIVADGVSNYSPEVVLNLDRGGSLSMPGGCIFNGGLGLGGITKLNMLRGAPNVIGLRGPSDLHTYFENVTIEPFDPANYVGVKPYFGDNVTLVLNYDVTLEQDLNVYGAVTIQGNNHRLTLGSKNISLTEDAALTLVNCIIPDIKGSPFITTRNENKIIFDNSDLHLISNLTFTQGGLRFANDVCVTGTSIFSYESSTSSTLNTNTRLVFDNGMTFSYSPKSARNWLFEMSDASSILYLNGATLKTTTTGLLLKRGTLLLDGLVNVYNDNAVAVSQSISLGTGVATSDLAVIVMPSASLALKSGILNYANAS